MRHFRDLQVWQRAHTLALAVRRTQGRFRAYDNGPLRSQLIRAAESIPANIAEGCFASSQKEFARFLDIAVKSSGELEYHLLLAHEHGLLIERTWQRLTAESVEVRKMLVGLRRRVLVSEPAKQRQR